ncbi:hypothetical protein [Xenorhabdus lircayensis]|uniref:Uncharacterized protein n=1 Tax=Xenorhabdus lircayensis TaxID=2763499 RepID=A0ABS0U8I2_9GAMM|nr:hypothetical protein [Xenorhabdus lircayensis]MBI6549081.1 hypothetical protein [Xenorhabdus lircayensis]
MIESISQDAIKHSRNIFRGKTTNKIYRDLTKLSVDKRAMHTPDNIILREDKHDEFLDQFREIEHPTDKYRHSLYKSNSGEELIGNCGELTIAAFNYLAIYRYNDILRWFRMYGRWDRSNIMKPVYILFLMFNDPYDHCISVITHPEHTPHIPTINKPYRILPDNSWVCDPWANIACSSETYNTRWQNKMQKWDEKGKTTSIYQPDQELDDNMHYPSPLKKNNYNAITNSIKTVKYMAVIQSDGKVKIT